LLSLLDIPIRLSRRKGACLRKSLNDLGKRPTTLKQYAGKIEPLRPLCGRSARHLPYRYNRKRQMSSAAGVSFSVPRRSLEVNLPLKLEVVIDCVRGVISPLLSNLYLNEVDRMLEKAVDTTRRGKSTNVQYARFADDMVILIDAERRSDWLVKAIDKRLREEFAKLRVAINEDKSRMVDLKKGESFTFLGFQLSAEGAAILCAQDEEADSAVCKAQGGLPTACQLAH